jgi:hypothetical protein
VICILLFLLSSILLVLKGKLDKLMMVDRDEVRREHIGEEDGIITAIPKDKAENLLEVIRNGMDRDREYRHREQPQQ